MHSPHVGTYYGTLENTIHFRSDLFTSCPTYLYSVRPNHFKSNLFTSGPNDSLSISCISSTSDFKDYNCLGQYNQARKDTLCMVSEQHWVRSPSPRCALSWLNLVSRSIINVLYIVVITAPCIHTIISKADPSLEADARTVTDTVIDFPGGSS